MSGPDRKIAGPFMLFSSYHMEETVQDRRPQPGRGRHAERLTAQADALHHRACGHHRRVVRRHHPRRPDLLRPDPHEPLARPDLGQRHASPDERRPVLPQGREGGGPALLGRGLLRVRCDGHLHRRVRQAPGGGRDREPHHRPRHDGELLRLRGHLCQR